MKWAEDKISRFEHALNPGRCSIADIGAGRGFVTLGLMRRGHEVIPIDVRDGSRVSSVRPVIYDGQTLPFADDRFDVALLLTVLHHTPDPDRVLAEASRIASRLIVIEDIASSALKMRLTWWADSVANLEFRGHPHTNRSDAAWRATFCRLGLRVREARSDRVFRFFSQMTYILDRKEGST
ncbi:MAG: class I SAM-dependent methyltransferase [Spirochaetales bacterium]